MKTVWIIAGVGAAALVGYLVYVNFIATPTKQTQSGAVSIGVGSTTIGASFNV